MAPFAVATPFDGEYYFIKLVDLKTGAVAARIFMPAGARQEYKVPLGSYEMRYATGTTWYGEEALFGAQTRTYKAESVFNFYVSGNEVSGAEVELIKQRHGNLDTHAIPVSRF
jgi:hypothetical protein